MEGLQAGQVSTFSLLSQLLAAVEAEPGRPPLDLTAREALLLRDNGRLDRRGSGGGGGFGAPRSEVSERGRSGTLSIGRSIIGDPSRTAAASRLTTLSPMATTLSGASTRPLAAGDTGAGSITCSKTSLPQRPHQAASAVISPWQCGHMMRSTLSVAAGAASG